MAVETKPFDPADYLDNEEAIAAYLTEALDTGDAAFINDAIGVVARAVGMTKVAKDTGLSRESLYRALKPEGNPEFSTVLKVLNSFGIALRAVPTQAGGRPL